MPGHGFAILRVLNRNRKYKFTVQNARAMVSGRSIRICGLLRVAKFLRLGGVIPHAELHIRKRLSIHESGGPAGKCGAV
jgi:hypothetical protein